jgi:hypothetical protein
MSTRTVRPRPAAAGLAVALLCMFVSLPAQQHRSGKRLTRAELVQLLDCLTRSEFFRLDPQYSGRSHFRLRYLYDPGTIGGIRHPSIHSVTYPNNAIELIVYSHDGKSALLYETQIIRKPNACHLFLVLNVASLEREKRAWRLKETQEGIWTMARVQKTVDVISAEAPLVTVPVTDAGKTCATCQMGVVY